MLARSTSLALGMASLEREIFLNPYFFASNSIAKFLQLFSSDFELLVNNEQKDDLTTDDQLSIKLGNTLNTDPENLFFKKMIGLSYSFFNKIFSSKKINSDKPTILLVNFTTLRMQKFFEELPNHDINLIKYDTIVPAFWNSTTFSLIKKF